MGFSGKSLSSKEPEIPNNCVSEASNVLGVGGTNGMNHVQQ